VEDEPVIRDNMEGGEDGMRNNWDQGSWQRADIFLNKKTVGDFPTSNIFSQKEKRSYLQDVGGRVYNLRY
jgi:hypothetical protein